MHVLDLIEEDRREWKREFVEENFNVRDAQCILEIPLYDEGQKDLMSWKFTSTGVVIPQFLTQIVADTCRWALHSYAV